MTRDLVRGIAVKTLTPETPGGTPVLLLHGIGGCANSFAALAPVLASAGWRTIAWDAPGYGGSADPDPSMTGPDSAHGYATGVHDLLHALNATPAHVVGVSWGGVIATCMAASRPEVVASLTLVDSTRGSAVTPEQAAGMRSRVTELVELGSRVFAARRSPRLLASGAGRDVALEVERQMSQVRVPGYSGAAEMMARTDTGPLLGSLDVPTLVIVGDQDRVTGLAESTLLAERIPGARLHVVADAGHAAVQEQPDRVADILLPFLARNPARRRTEDAR